LMPGGIYLIQGDGSLVEMEETAYDSEDLLQGLLAEYPNLLAGDQVDGAEPRRWLLISREMPLASEEDGSGRWSVDHLFLDQDAVPTIVEVKRSTDTRIRREVVGQMLDYAANAVVYWPVEDLQARFESKCEARGVDAEAEVEDALGVAGGQEEFWQKAKTNLQAGRVRLVFVADEIPSELRRVVEFLNEQMDPAEVLAVEIKQYVGEDLKTLVPRVVGQTAEAQHKKAGSALGTHQWNEPTFFRVLEERRGAEGVASVRRILEWAKARKLRIRWGRGRQFGSFSPELDHGGRPYTFVRVYTEAYVNLLFANLYQVPPFDDQSLRRELLHRLNEVPGLSFTADKLAKRPGFSLSRFKDAAALERFLGTLDWVVEEIEGP
jgi:hypothetical protein